MLSRMLVSLVDGSTLRIRRFIVFWSAIHVIVTAVIVKRDKYIISISTIVIWKNYI